MITRSKSKANKMKRSDNKNLLNYYEKKSRKMIKGNSGKTRPVKDVQNPAEEMKSQKKKRHSKKINSQEMKQNDIRIRKLLKVEHKKEFYTKKFLNEISRVKKIDGNLNFKLDNFDSLRTQMKDYLGLLGFESLLIKQEFDQLFEFCIKRSITLSNSYEWYVKFKPILISEVSITHLTLLDQIRRVVQKSQKVGGTLPIQQKRDYGEEHA